MSYADAHRQSLSDPEAFWMAQALRLSWERPPERALSVQGGRPRWFAGGTMNTAYMALDAHVEAGRGEATALIYDSPVTGSQRRYSFAALRDEVARCAGALAGLGVVKGDRVILYMPMIPEAVIAMLACARLGAVHSVVFGGFAPHELAVRIDDARPKLLLTASCGVEVDRVLPYKDLVDAALEEAEHPPERVLVFERPELAVTLTPGRDLDWATLMATARPAAPVPVDATDPLYILYTSGTTGRPKGVVRDNGGHAVALRYSMEAIYGVGPGDVFWAASDIGWVVGHSYIVYAPLLTGCATVLYEGKPVRTPDASAFWRVISEHRVNAFFTAPTAFRAIKKVDPEAQLMRGHDLSSLRALFLAGERLDPPTLSWLEGLVDVPVIDHWWQTETGWPMVATAFGLGERARRSGSAGRPVPGYDVRVVDEGGEPRPPGEVGDVVVRLPLPPGTLPTLWEDDARFAAAYLDPHPGYYHTADGGYIDADGFVFIMGRTDDNINVAGHRLSTGEMEEIVGAHPAVAECAVVGIQDPLKGQVPVGFVVLKDGVRLDPAALEAELVADIRREIGPIACFKQAVVLGRLPKTRSGKILRTSMRRIADTGSAPAPATIDDPAILGEVQAALRARGVGVFGAEG
ncbi:MAG: propionyl-CoA synthetase [Alphaproteobacteria bacterium]|nr:propionyl-CoA synthetase [Alphaproteobacteria bacterium]